jgi:hypothetical protein
MSEAQRKSPKAGSSKKKQKKAEASCNLAGFVFPVLVVVMCVSFVIMKRPEVQDFIMENTPLHSKR